METVQEVIKVAVKVGLVPALRDHGYRKNGMHFYRACDECTQVLNVQSNKFNTRQEGSFTINLGVFSRHCINWWKRLR